MSDIENPPENFDGEVNLDEFWESVSLERIASGLVLRKYMNYSLQ